jgi:hypothetical protein
MGSCSLGPDPIHALMSPLASLVPPDPAVPELDGCELSRDRVLLHRGLLAARGDLVLTDHALRFEAKGWSHGVVAGERSPLDLIELRRAGWTRFGFRVQVASGQARWLLSGAGAHRVLSRLWSVRRDLAPMLTPTFEAGERVLVQGTVGARTLGGLPGIGDLWLTDRRVRFCPWPMAGALGPPPLETAPGRVTLRALAGPVPRAELVVADRSLVMVLSGAVVQRALALYALIRRGARDERGSLWGRTVPARVVHPTAATGPVVKMVSCGPVVLSPVGAAQEQRCTVVATGIRRERIGVAGAAGPLIGQPVGGIAVRPGGVFRFRSILREGADGHLSLDLPRLILVFNRRASFRASIRCPVTLHLPQGESVRGTLRDLSVGGAGVVTPSALPCGTWLRLDARLPGGEIQARAQVLRVETMGAAGSVLGLRFQSLDLQTRRQIERLVLALERDEHEEGGPRGASQPGTTPDPSS